MSTYVDSDLAEPPGLAEMKQFSRQTWAAGDFPEVARRTLWEVGERLVRRMRVSEGERVLDVACGTGNAALRAADAGAEVVGLDLTPELLDVGRRLAEQRGRTVDWVEGDAESLPYDEGRFDVVLSTFGCMFAPRHRVAAAEAARVLRSGGRLGICSWTPEGMQGEFFRTLGAHLPPAPAFAMPPLLWGSEAHVTDIFSGTGVRFEFERDAVLPNPDETGFEAVDWAAANFGPLMLVRARLEQTGQWAALREDLAALYDRHQPAEYLVAIGRKD